MAQVLNINRMIWFAKRMIIMNGKSLIIGFGALAGFLLFILSMNLISEPYISSNAILGTTMPFVYLAGFIVTSLVFREMHTPGKAYHYLTLPVSNLERLITSWLVTAVFYLLAALIALYVINGLLFAVSTFVPGANVQFVDLFSKDLYQALAVYLVIQPVFLVGAAYFRKNTFLKTLLALFVISLIIAAYAVLNAYLIFGPEPQMSFSHNNINIRMEELFTSHVPEMAKIFFWYVQLPLLLIISYFRLKETQI